MERQKVLSDIASLISDINNCTSDIVYGRKHGEVGLIASVKWRMESLMVQANQELGFLYDYIKERGKDEDSD